MTTPVAMHDQLAMLRMVIDRRDPAHVEAEAAVICEGEIAGPVVNRMMLGTVEAYDALEQDAERRKTTAAKADICKRAIGNG